MRLNALPEWLAQNLSSSRESNMAERRPLIEGLKPTTAIDPIREAAFVRGDKAANYGDIARVMGRIRDAGFRKISLVTEVEGGG